jgi:hypothetical protein
LTFLEEAYAQGRAKELKGLPLETKTAVEQARTRGDKRLTDSERQAFVSRYEEVLLTWLAANPPPQRRPG